MAEPGFRVATREATVEEIDAYSSVVLGGALDDWSAIRASADEAADLSVPLSTAKEGFR
jgi:hypothetical protein